MQLRGLVENFIANFVEAERESSAIEIVPNLAASPEQGAPPLFTDSERRPSSSRGTIIVRSLGNYPEHSYPTFTTKTTFISQRRQPSGHVKKALEFKL